MEKIDSINDYNKLIDYKIMNFTSKNGNCCLALTKSNLQCTHNTYNKNNILCKLHRSKKYKPEYIIVYIDSSDENHIIAYPYKNKEQYCKDIEIYKNELKDIFSYNVKKIELITTCKVCEDTFIHNKLIKCSNITCNNAHLVCSHCLIGYIESLITSNIGSYDCMFNKLDKCNGNYSIASIDQVISTHIDIDSKLSIWKDLVNITDIFKLANVCDNYLICPLCRKWGCILEICNDITEPINIKCMNCKLEWCNLCKREAHIDNSCYKLIFKDSETDEKRISIIDTMLQNIISKALTHACSTCGCAYIKEEGCNLMYCSQCNGMSCYICNAKIYIKEGKGKYWHFAGHELSEIGATCPIWNNKADDGKEKQGNTEYNNNKIIKELLIFIDSNYKNIQEIIYNRIKNLYEKDEALCFIIKIIEKYL